MLQSWKIFFFPLSLFFSLVRPTIVAYRGFCTYTLACTDMYVHRVIPRARNGQQYTLLLYYRMFSARRGYVVATRWCIFTRATPEITPGVKGVYTYFSFFSSLSLSLLFFYSPLYFRNSTVLPASRAFAVHTITPAGCTKIFIVLGEVMRGLLCGAG